MYTQNKEVEFIEMFPFKIWTLTLDSHYFIAVILDGHYI